MSKHIYCVGYFRTGTTTVANMFQEMRSAHEPEALVTAALVLEWQKGFHTKASMQDELRIRDARLRLDMESNSVLGNIARPLATLNDDSKFILTVREPAAWLKSQLNYHLNMLSPAWCAWRAREWWSKQGLWAPEESGLKNNGLLSLRVYLQSYSEHISRVLNSVPSDRLLVLRTDRLSGSLPDVSAFTGVPVDCLFSSRSNEGMFALRQAIDLAEYEFFLSEVNDYCGWIYKEFGFKEPGRKMNA